MSSLFRAALFAAIAAPSIVVAQDENVAPLILRLPSSTRALAMGNVGVAGRDDDVLFYNPAQLVTARGMSVSAEQFSSTARTGALSSVTRFNSGGIAIGATIAQYQSPIGAYPLARPDLVAGGAVHGSAGTLALGMAQVFKSVRLGGVAKLVDEQIGQSRNTRAVFDAGAGRDFFGYTFGLAVQNIGESFAPTTVPGSGIIAVSHMPLRATLGVARGWFFNTFDVAATAAVSTLRDGFVVPAGGAELGWSWLDGYTLLLRAGARRPEVGEGPVTAGAGFTMDRLSIDYALESLSGSRVAHRVGLRVR
jgi:hypothetical protein